MRFFVFFTIYVVLGCPSIKDIRHNVSFEKVVIQQPFPYPYNGIEVFNGVKTQNKGLCNTTKPQNCTIPTKKCVCNLFSKYLLFNLIPINENKQLKPKDITTAVKEAKNITFVNSIKMQYDTLCSYDVSEWTHTFSCLPKFCKQNKTNVCLRSSSNCTCIAQPCNLYVFI